MKPPLRERRACLAKLVKNRLTLTVKSAFATPSLPISDIEVFHTDRGSEFDNAEIDLMPEAFGIERSLSAKGCPYDNAVDESANRILKAELVHRETFGTTLELRAKVVSKKLV